MANETPNILGVRLSNGARVAHGTAGNVKVPLDYAPVTMHELYNGQSDIPGLSFEGQFGFIEFDTNCRLPRHVHMATDSRTGEQKLLPERILVLNGVGVVELSGGYFVIPPGALIDIPPGVAHTWNACPSGVTLPDGTVSDGRFTMVYNYSEETRFFPTAHTQTLVDARDYIPFTGDIEQIRFPRLSTLDVRETCALIWNDTVATKFDAFG